MSKTVPFKTPVKAADPADKWVSSRPGPDVVEDTAIAVLEPPEPAEPIKRFTIDVSESLHKRIKSQCAMRGVKMADVIRQLLEEEFPKG
ncbi:MAG: plasmid partition protein ParG [Beijerinckiaceae bacterium]|nr:plasmid partition protein ParG [Beijerinckiaceae bacterium]